MRQIELTDEQYLELLKRGRKYIDSVKKATGYDDTTIGEKDTQTNVGLCNRDLTWEEIALFPDKWPQRKSMLYRQYHHKCPLDTRPASKETRSGCFYTCRFFQERLRDLNKIRTLYDTEIERVEQEISSVRGTQEDADRV